VEHLRPSLVRHPEERCNVSNAKGAISAHACKPRAAGSYPEITSSRWLV
jgi:hypothetical protein